MFRKTVVACFMYLLVFVLFSPSLSVSKDSQRQKVAKWQKMSVQFYELFIQAKFVEANAVAEKLLIVTEETFGKEHELYPRCLGMVGTTLYLQGKFDKAEPYFVEALKLREKQVGAEDVKLVEYLDLLADVVFTQGKYDEAAELYRRSLEIMKQRYSEEHEEVAKRLGKLAPTLLFQGKYDEAEPYFMRGIEILEKRFGKKHKNTKLAREEFEKYKKGWIEFSDMVEKAEKPGWFSTYGKMYECLGSSVWDVFLTKALTDIITNGFDDNQLIFFQGNKFFIWNYIKADLKRKGYDPEIVVDSDECIWSFVHEYYVPFPKDSTLAQK